MQRSEHIKLRINLITKLKINITPIHCSGFMLCLKILYIVFIKYVYVCVCVRLCIAACFVVDFPDFMCALICLLRIPTGGSRSTHMNTIDQLREETTL